MNDKKCKPVIKRQAREIVFKVFTYFKDNKSESETLKNVKEKTAEATGVSISTIERIVREGKTSLQIEGEIKFSSPRKKRVRRSTVTELPQYQSRDIRQIIYDLHKTEGCQITVKRLQQKIGSQLNFHPSESSLRRIVKKIGFVWRATPNNKKLLTEKFDVRLMRIKYLKRIKYFRNENRPIVFIGRTHLHSGPASSKNETEQSTKGLPASVSKGRLILFHAAGEMGLIPNSLYIFKSGPRSADYHSEINSENYEKWLREILIPNLPHNCVIVTDNAPDQNPVPAPNSKKTLMVKWLTEKKISFDASDLKPELYEIIKRNKEHYATHELDKMLNLNGHTMLLLPPYHPDLNLMELVFTVIKNNVSKKNVTFRLEDVIKLATDELENISRDDWHKYCQDIIKIEDEYLERETNIDTESDTNPLIVELKESSDESDSYLESDDSD